VCVCVCMYVYIYIHIYILIGFAQPDGATGAAPGASGSEHVCMHIANKICMYVHMSTTRVHISRTCVHILITQKYVCM